MNYLKKNMKPTNKQTLWLIFTITCVGLAPRIFEIADQSRGYDATGGEMFIFLLPVLAWLVNGIVTDTKEEMEEYGK